MRTLYRIMQYYFWILLSIYSMSSLANGHNLLNIDNDEPVSLSFYQTETSIILQALADYRHINLVIPEELSSPITIKLQNVPWHKALNIILASAKLMAEQDDNLLIIKRQVEPLTLQQQQEQAYQEWLRKQPLEYLSLKVNYVDIDHAVNLIQQQGLLSARGKSFIDARTQTIVIYDINQQFSAIKQLIAEFDRHLPQVHIAAHIVTMSSESLSQLGIHWGYASHQSQTINNIDLGRAVSNPVAQMGMSVAKLAGNLLSLELSALEAENQVDIIASPNLLTSNQHTASIKQGTEIPYEVSSGSNGATSIEFKQAVLGLEVTPRILNNGQLELNLHISQNTAGRPIKRGDGGEALAIDTQEIKTQVIVNTGETLVLGGIFQQLNSKEVNQVPGLSQIPLLGGLFKYSGEKQQRRELVIFITPQLVSKLPR